MYLSINWKRHPPSLKFCNNASISLSCFWEMKAILKDTIQAYFCYCHTFLQTATLSGLNLSFNGCSLIQLRESKEMILTEEKIDYKKKKRNRLLSKGMSNIYLKVTIETFSKLRLSRFKEFDTRSVFGDLQLTQITLNFRTSCCNLKISGLGAKLCVAFLLFEFWKELWLLKVKEFMFFVEQKNKL